MYIITYEDGKILKNIPWNDIKDKPIKNIKYVIGNKTLIMENYEHYNHLVKRKLGIDNKILEIRLLGCCNDLVTTIVFDFMKHSIYKESATLGYEYNNGLSTGWKQGVKNKANRFYFIPK